MYRLVYESDSNSFPVGGDFFPGGGRFFQRSTEGRAATPNRRSGPGFPNSHRGAGLPSPGEGPAWCLGKDLQRLEISALGEEKKMGGGGRASDFFSLKTISHIYKKNDSGRCSFHSEISLILYMRAGGGDSEK